jgi:hypothetical protein
MATLTVWKFDSWSVVPSPSAGGGGLLRRLALPGRRHHRLRLRRHLP